MIAADSKRQRWMRTFALAPLPSLEAAWRNLREAPRYDLLRRPETGLAMVRARAGGTGARFNLGEMTMTRAVVRLADGTTGFGFVAGRSRRHAELAAVFDAMMQDERIHADLARDLVTELDAARAAADLIAKEKAAATKVEFFTVNRGDSAP